MSNRKKKVEVIPGYQRAVLNVIARPYIREPSIKTSGNFSVPAQQYLDYYMLLKEWKQRNKIQFGEIITLEFYFKMPTHWNKVQRDLKKNTGHDHKPILTDLVYGFSKACLNTKKDLNTVIARKYWSTQYQIYIGLPKNLNKEYFE